MVSTNSCAAGVPNEHDDQAEQTLGRSVDSFSTKIYVIVAALLGILWVPLRLLLTGGQKGDATQAIPLLESFDFAAVLAERSYDADQLFDFIAQTKTKAVIPAQKNRLIQSTTEWHPYKPPHLVEYFMS